MRLYAESNFVLEVALEQEELADCNALIDDASGNAFHWRFLPCLSSSPTTRSQAAVNGDEIWRSKSKPRSGSLAGRRALRRVVAISGSRKGILGVPRGNNVRQDESWAEKGGRVAETSVTKITCRVARAVADQAEGMPRGGRVRACRAQPRSRKLAERFSRVCSVNAFSLPRLTTGNLSRAPDAATNQQLHARGATAHERRQFPGLRVADATRRALGLIGACCRERLLSLPVPEALPG